jgi:hypothetical protein
MSKTAASSGDTNSLQDDESSHPKHQTVSDVCNIFWAQICSYSRVASQMSNKVSFFEVESSYSLQYFLSPIFVPILVLQTSRRGQMCRRHRWGWVAPRRRRARAAAHTDSSRHRHSHQLQLLSPLPPLQPPPPPLPRTLSVSSRWNYPEGRRGGSFPGRFRGGKIEMRLDSYQAWTKRIDIDGSDRFFDGPMFSGQKNCPPDPDWLKQTRP